jgi:hypothetical protein
MISSYNQWLKPYLTGNSCRTATFGLKKTGNVVQNKPFLQVLIDFYLLSTYNNYVGVDKKDI